MSGGGAERALQMADALGHRRACYSPQSLLQLRRATPRIPEATDDQILLSPVPKSCKGCSVPRGSWPRLRGGADRYPQGRTVRSRVPRDQPERQDPGAYRRRCRAVRFDGDLAISCAQDRSIPRRQDRCGSGADAFLVDAGRYRDRSLWRTGGSLQAFRTRTQGICPQSLHL